MVLIRQLLFAGLLSGALVAGMALALVQPARTAATALDGSVVANQAPGNSATFKLKGGTYGLSATATGTGTFGLQRLANDGATWVPVHTAFTTGQNYLAVTIPAGSYRITSATVTALYFEVAGITGSP